MGETLFNRKRKILKKKFVIKKQIESLTSERNALNSKGDISAALKLNDEINDLKDKLNLINEELENFDFINKFSYLEEKFLDNLSDDEESTFLYFKKDDFIPINSMINYTYDSLEKNSSKVLSIGKTLSTSLSDSESKSLIKKLFTNFEDNKKNSVYISLCYIQFKDYYAPLLFIPVIIENPYDYKILRDVNQDVIYNVIVKNKLKEFDINLPDFNGDIDLFMDDLKKIEEVYFKNDIFLSNCNLEKIFVFNDVNLDKWESFSSKLNVFSDNKGCYLPTETKNINNKIAKQWPNLNLKLNEKDMADNHDVLIKNLLSNGDSILYVSNNSDSVKNSLINSNIGPIILDLNENTSWDSFKIQINERLIKTFDKSEKIDITYEKAKINRTISTLKNPFLNFNILPMKIKEKMEYYSNHINGDKIIVPITNISKYSISYFDEVNKQILDLINKSHGIENFKKYFEIDLLELEYNYINSLLNSLESYIDEFISLNKMLNKNIKLKLFYNLSSVRYLTNLNVLTKKHQYIEMEDRVYLNEFIKNYEEQNFKKSNNDLESLTNFNNNLLDLKPKLIEFNENLSDLVNFLKGKNEDYIISNQNLTECKIDLDLSIEYIDELTRYLDILNSKDINQIKKDISKSEENSDDLYNKYFDSNDNIFETLENNVKYTELIDYKIIEDESLIKNNLLSMTDKIEYFYQVYKNILKVLNSIFNFYKKNSEFEVPEGLFDENTSFSELKDIIHALQEDLILFNSINNKNLNKFVAEYMNLYFDEKIDEDDISDIFYFNVYKSLFDEFLRRYPDFSNKNLDYKYYELQLENITINMWELQYNNFMHDIYKKPRALTFNNKNKIISLNKKIETNQIDNIKSALNYKDCIMSNKRIFILNSSSVFKYLDNTYENSFDYVILGNVESISDYELLSLLFRSKNKIINVNKV